MFKLTVIDNPRLAQAFIDYMASLNVDIDMIPEEGGHQFSLWLKNDEERAKAEFELKCFLANPNDKKYQAASWELADSRKQKFEYAAPSMFAMIKAKAGLFTLSVMFVSLVLFLLLQMGFRDNIFLTMHFPATEQQQWQLWRWFSHALLHFSVIHIAFNLLWWWQLAGDIEKRLGSAKLLQLFIFSAALSGVVQFWVEDANFGGLSGVVYALMGYSWLLGVLAPDKGLGLPKSIAIFMIIWLVFGFIQPYMAIANTAHLVGLIAGLTVGWSDCQISRIQKE